MKKKLLIYILIIIGSIIFDQLTKIAAADILPAMGGSYEFIPGFVSFTYAQNTGAAFSLFSGNTIILAALSLIVSGVLFVIMCKTINKNSVILSLSLSFIVGGAIGNIIDRFMLGFVRDMIQFTFVDFAIFNVADSFACIGVALLAVFLIFIWKDDKPKKTK